ncbi:MAG: transglutaminaseTgpA domain-containing protein [Myxococcota bacterium]|nr:transglutaminaseTgpA domain-containing protein [Myxococcota bacterium]
MKLRFRIVHKSSTYLLILTSMAALLWPGEWSAATISVLVLMTCLSWFWEPTKFPVKRLNFLWNLATILMLIKVVMEIVAGGGVLMNAMDFILFLGINKLFNRSSNQDYQQLYIVSLLQMIAATTVNTDPSFGLLFFVYVVAVTWTLILFHLRREMQDNLLLKYGHSLDARPVAVERMLNSKRLIGGRFLLVTSGLAILVFLIAGTFFFIFPRLGFRLFQQNRAGQTVAGFSDSVDLGQFGLIKDNPTVVMRIEFEKGAPETTETLYWRGISFDHYDGRSWSKSRVRDKRSLPRYVDTVYVRRPQLDSTRRTTQKIYLDPMAQRVLFGLSDILSIKLPERPEIAALHRYRAIQQDADGDLFYEQLDEVAFKYSVSSETRQPTAKMRQLKVRHVRDLKSEQRRYRQLPTNLSPAIRALANQLVKPEQTLFEAAAAVESYLENNLTYTLDLKRNEALSPLDDFLFEQKSGHCEYFATAMTILLRAGGLEARLVNGFQGGKWNPFGNYLAVSQGDAHSWVELAVPAENCTGVRCQPATLWHRFDPTPPSAARSTTLTLLDRFRAYADAFRMRWYKHVIEYDIEQQASAIMSVRDAWTALSTALTDKTELSQRRRSHLVQFAVVCLILFTILFILVGRRRASTTLDLDSPPPEIRMILTLVDELLQTYASQGVVKEPHETLREFIERVDPTVSPGMELAERIRDCHEQIRFAQLDIDLNRLQQLSLELEQVKKHQTKPT